jgi:hypothetical protein
MHFENSPTDSRTLIATDYWDTTKAQEGKPVVSFSGRCFRLILPTKSMIGPERYAQLAGILQRPPSGQHPAIDADSHRLMIRTGALLTAVNWSEVYGITAADFPANPQACDFAVYVFAGKRGPRMAFCCLATHQAVPF